MNYKSFNLGDWIGHISGAIEDERELDGNEMRDLVEFLSGLPKWIPCSERMPEDRREVLVTTYWHETYQVMIGSYFGDGLWWCVPFNNSGEHMQKLKPKAWMPLPESYKAESEEINEDNMHE